MYMIQLIYVSCLSEGLDRKDLEAILKVSRKNNEEKGITGILCYDPQFFLQCLEGPRDVINDLYKMILHDKRHKNVVLLEYSDITQREFSDWSMAYLTTSDFNSKILFKYSPDKNFNPYMMTAEQAHSFLVELARERFEFLEKQIAEHRKKSSE